MKFRRYEMVASINLFGKFAKILETAKGIHFSINSDNIIKGTGTGRFLKPNESMAFENDTVWSISMIANKYAETISTSQETTEIEKYALEMKINGKRFVAMQGKTLEYEGGRGTRINLLVQTNQTLEQCYQSFFEEDAKKKDLLFLEPSNQYKMLDTTDDNQKYDIIFYDSVIYNIPKFLNPLLIEIGDLKIQRPSEDSANGFEIDIMKTTQYDASN